MPNSNSNPEPGNGGNPHGKPTIGVGHNMNRLRSSGVGAHPRGKNQPSSKPDRNDSSPPVRPGVRDSGPRA